MILTIRIKVNGVQIDAQSIAVPPEWTEAKAVRWAGQQAGTIEAKSYPIDNGTCVQIERELRA